jgi:hypothetical protein
MPWTKLDQALPTHPKTLRLAELLGFSDPDLAWAKIARLWLWALDYCPNGRLTVAERPVSEQQIAFAANFHGDATLFVRSLIDAGFLDSVRGGVNGKTLQIHDWQYYGGRYFKALEYDRDRKSGRNPDGINTDSRLDSGGEEKRGEEKRIERGGEEGTPPPLEASPGGRAEETEIMKTVHQFSAWAHPSLDKKIEGVREMRSLGLSHDYIRKAAELNRPADYQYWDIVKALKAGKTARRNGKGVKIPGANGHPPSDKPLRLQEPLDQVHRRRAEAIEKCDAALRDVDPATLAAWTAEAERSVLEKKVPAALRKSAVDVELRLRVAKKIGVSI